MEVHSSKKTTLALKELGFETCITARDKHHERLSCKVTTGLQTKDFGNRESKATDPTDSIVPT